MDADDPYPFRLPHRYWRVRTLEQKNVWNIKELQFYAILICTTPLKTLLVFLVQTQYTTEPVVSEAASTVATAVIGLLITILILGGPTGQQDMSHKLG